MAASVILKELLTPAVNMTEINISDMTPLMLILLSIVHTHTFILVDMQTLTAADVEDDTVLHTTAAARRCSDDTTAAARRCSDDTTAAARRCSDDTTAAARRCSDDPKITKRPSASE
eukprot:superscaffoldBa00012865_g25809